MKLYVAGKWEERLNVKLLMVRLKSIGHEITMDWTDSKYEDEAYPVEYSIADIDGVYAADMYAGLFVRPYQYRGALVEMGVALGLRIPCAIIGHQIDSCIFVHHPLVTQYDSTTDFVLAMRHD